MPSNAKIPASVYILTKNSAKTLRRTLGSVSAFADIVVCDGGSEDDTVSIARSFGANVFSQSRSCLAPDGLIADFACVRTDCMDHAKYDWVIFIDSDETASPGLVEEIREVAEGRAGKIFDAYEVPMAYERADGRMIKYSSNFPGYQKRFFTKKFGAYFYKSPHSRVRFREKSDSEISVGRFKNPWINYLPDGGYWRRYWRSNAKFMRLELSHLPFTSRMTRLGAVYNSFRSALGLGFRALGNYILHGFRDSMPVTLESARVLYHIVLGLRIFIMVFAPYLRDKDRSNHVS